MENKIKIIIIVIIVVGLTFILLGVVYESKDKKEIKIEKKPSPTVVIPESPVAEGSPTPSSSDEEKATISKEEALEIIKRVYDKKSLVINFKEEVDDMYIFEQKNDDLILFYTFMFNKKTGEIIQEENPNATLNY